MAYRIKASDIPMKVRAPHLSSYKSQLRQALLNPGLSDQRRDEIKTKLASFGQPKDYAQLATLKGHFRPDRAELGTMTKAELHTLGEHEGVSVSQRLTKAEMIDAILANRTK